MTSTPRINPQRLHAGTRVAVAVSGGADSVGLLRALADFAPEAGWVLTVAHVHHGLRGIAADEDEQFVARLADRLQLDFLLHRVDTPRTARDQRRGLEETARHLRYTWFRDLLAQGKADAIATAHTLDDQAETVLHRLLRGAWTEGLGGIHPVVVCTGGVIVRPFLQTRRVAIREWLTTIAQTWREDESNQDLSFTRNRIRHELLPHLASYNPSMGEHLAHLATIARDEEAWWAAELSRLLPSLLLPGRAVRGGGRSVSTHPDEGCVAIELQRLRAFAPAVQRRLVRAAVLQLGCDLDFEQTEALMSLGGPEAPRKRQLSAEVRAERTPRELRLIREASTTGTHGQQPEPMEFAVPGEVAGLGVRLRAVVSPGAVTGAPLVPAQLRGPRAGDRVRLRHSRNAKPLKEVFERMQVEGSARKEWPLVEWSGQIIWMRGVEVDPDPEPPFLIERVGEKIGDGA